jgi:hypothetical protein
MALIERWVAEGSQRQPTRTVVNLRVEPAVIYLPGPDSTAQIQVLAEFGDHSQRDVTTLAVMTPDDPASVTVSGDGRLAVSRRGRFTVAVRFLTQLRAIQVTVPLREPPGEAAPAVSGNWIDNEIQATLSELSLTPSPQSDGATLLRRLRLDLTGRLPGPDELQNYLADQSAGKYEGLVDRLLESNQFLDFWTYRVGRWLDIPVYAVRKDRRGAEVYRDWLRSELANDTGWDQIARQLILATGDSHLIGPANSHRQVNDARSEAEWLATALLGIELRCANCHNHPLDRWTQDDYHGLAAIFARLERGQVVSVRPRGEVSHPATGGAAVPRLPGERFLASDVDGRAELSAWLTHPDNPYFARALVNRVWKELMGRGLVEPVDAIRATNPGTHPALLDRLALEFTADRFSLRKLIRRITMSLAYRRSSRATAVNQGDDRFYSRALTRPLAPEVFVDAVIDVTTSPRTATAGENALRAIETLDAFAKHPDVVAVNGCPSPAQCRSDETIGSDLATRLQLINGAFLNQRIAAEQGVLAAFVARGATNDEIVLELYQRALARSPSQSEVIFWQMQLAGAESTRLERLQDFFWSLLSSREFMSNH